MPKFSSAIRISLVTFALFSSLSGFATDRTDLGNRGGLSSQAEPYYPCQAAGSDPEQTKRDGQALAATHCSTLMEMAAKVDPTVKFVFQNAAGMCRVTYQEGLHHLSNACGVEALMASHVRYLGALLSQPLASEQIERLARAEQVGFESDIQMNTARKATGNILAFHHALHTNLNSEGTVRLGLICRDLPRIRELVKYFEQMPEPERSKPFEKREAAKNRSLAEVLSHCDAALAELASAQEVNRNLVAVFDQGASRHQLSADRAISIQTDAGQIGSLLQGIPPDHRDFPSFVKDLREAVKKQPACHARPIDCARLTNSREFIKQVAMMPGGAVDRLSAEILELSRKEVTAYGGDPAGAADTFSKWAGFSMETAVGLLPRAPEAQDNETLTSLTKAELLKNLRTDYVNDLIADLAGESRLGILITITGQGTLEATHDHVVDHDPFSRKAILVGIVKNATALAGPLWGPVGDGMVDFVQSGNPRQGIAAFSGGMVFEGGKWAVARYVPVLAGQAASLQPYVVGGYYAYKAAQYGVFRLGQSEIEWGLPAGVKLEQGNYEYVQEIFDEEGIKLDPRRSYFDLWNRLMGVFHRRRAG